LLLSAVIAQMGIGRATSARGGYRTTFVAFSTQELTGPRLSLAARAVSSGQACGPGDWGAESWHHRFRRTPPCAGACPARTPRRRAGGPRGLDTSPGRAPLRQSVSTSVHRRASTRRPARPWSASGNRRGRWARTPPAEPAGRGPACVPTNGSRGRRGHSAHPWPSPATRRLVARFCRSDIAKERNERARSVQVEKKKETLCGRKISGQ
jgi:hypothetical protein